MNLIAVGNETIKITNDRKYQVSGKEISFPDVDVEEVIVITPEEGNALISEGAGKYAGDTMCRFSVINADSFEAGRQYKNALVMNFANAHSPGGGFKMGAKAQEEALCRCSTLYESISKDMYAFRRM